MSCFNCCNALHFSKETSKYKRPSQLEHKLQNRKWEANSYKPNITILEALEEIADGEVSVETLKWHSARCICHGCQVTLRQAVNKKADVESFMQLLHDITDKVPSRQRQEYFSKDFFGDKRSRCWSCMVQFPEGDLRRKRFNMEWELVEGMTVLEAVQSLFENEAQSLEGVYYKKTYVCKNCFNLLRQVVKAQCVYESYVTMFASLTNQNSPFARLRHGDSISAVDPDCSKDEYNDTAENVENEVDCDVSFKTVNNTVELPYTASKLTNFASEGPGSVGVKRCNKSLDMDGRGVLRCDASPDVTVSKRQKLNRKEITYHVAEDASTCISACKKKQDSNSQTHGNTVKTGQVDQECTGTRGSLKTGDKLSENVFKSSAFICEKEENNKKKKYSSTQPQQTCSVGAAGTFSAQQSIPSGSLMMISGTPVSKPVILDSSESKTSARSYTICVNLQKNEVNAVIRDNSSVLVDPMTVSFDKGAVSGGEVVIEVDRQAVLVDKRSSEVDRQAVLVDKRSSEVDREDEEVNKRAMSVENRAASIDKGAVEVAMVEEDVLFESNQDMSDEWILYYYPRFPGRAEFVRLVFVEAGVPWKECGLDGPSVWKLICGGEMPGYPHFAPPVLQKGDLQISQTSVICKYLGEQFGLVPDSVEDRIHAEQISLSCHDYIAEGRLSFHGIHPQGPYLSQKEATQPYIDRFVSERLPRWMKYFERVLSNNQEGKGFLYGDKLSYADLALLHIVRATEAQFPEAFKAADYMQNLKDFKLRMEARKNIADYLRSDKWLGFSGDSMM